MRLAKIVATIGPASKHPEMLKSLMMAGVNVFRINFSHAIHDELPTIVSNIRQISQELGYCVSILGDLQGPKFRTGTLPNHEPIELVDGQMVDLKANREEGSSTCITTPNKELVEILTPGQLVLLADGLFVLEVTQVHAPDHVSCKVIHGGKLGEKKGINIPGLKLNIPSLTEKDKEDARHVLKHQMDFVAMSFVQTKEDILNLRAYLEEHLPQVSPQGEIPQIVAKIERPTSLDDIDGIIDATDIIMVARGDLGVELRPEKVPVVQKMLIKKSNLAEKPVITATQMLESMINEPVPTRAEVSDVANAVFDGTDALMLSAETAAGKYPIQAVQTMAKVIVEAEENLPYEGQFLAALPEYRHNPQMMRPIICSLEFHQTIAQIAAVGAQKSTAKAIVVLSYSGNMAKRIAKQKPHCPIIALTPSERVQKQLNILWGVYPILIQQCSNSDDMLLQAERVIAEHDLVKQGDTIVFCAGQTELLGVSNTLKIYRFGEVAEQLNFSSIFKEAQKV